MNILNTIINFIFDVVFYPLNALSPIWGLVIISLLTGILMLLIFKRVSNQSGIRATKGHLKAHLLELRLYKDDAALSLKAIGDIFKDNLRYFSYAFKPMLILMIPVIFILIQLAARYENRPLNVNERAIISVVVSSPENLRDIVLQTPNQIEVETPPLRVINKNEINWRIKPLKQGEWKLKILKDGNAAGVVEKRIIVGDTFTSLSVKRLRGSSLAGILYPAESLLPSDSFTKEIYLRYPKQELTVFGLHIHWLILFFGLSIISGFALKGVFKVEV